MITATSMYIIMAFVGLMFGSFAGAAVWRLRARQLTEDKQSGEPVDTKELKRLRPLTEAKVQDDRSRCLTCHHQLAWYDLLPLASWASTGGKCRYCKAKIGWFEPVMELSTAALFVIFYHAWIATHTLTEWPLLILWLVAIVMLVILVAYDAKWFLLPDKIMFPLIAVAALIALWQIVLATDVLEAALSTVTGVVILGGLYLALWIISKGMWVGFGDVKLGLALGLLLGDWQLALLALFLANLIGTLIVVPGLATKKLSRKTHIPFGPFLVAGFFLALFFGQSWISYYIDASSHFLAFTLMV